MDGLLGKRGLEDYIYRYQNLRKAEKNKKRREDDQLNKIYQRNANRQPQDSKNALQDEEFELTPAYQRPRVRLDDLETEESYEKNKNNPELYPSLKMDDSGGTGGQARFGATNKNIANNAVKKILELEEKYMQEKLRKLSANQPAKEAREPDEEELERELQGNSIVIIKKPSKKKKGKGRSKQEP